MQSQIPTPTRSNRIRRSADQWRDILRCFEESNLSIYEFCNQESLSRATFQRWRSRFNKMEGSTGFLELHPPEPAPSPAGSLPWSLELDLPGGGRLHIRSGL